jgi:hypothetical protein
MGSALTPEKCISVSKSGIILGNKVAAFFKSRGTILVNMVLNYNNSSLIIIDTGLRENILMNHADQGLKITYETSYKKNTNVKLTQLIKFLNIDYLTIFRAKPFKGNSVIIENIPLRDAVSLRSIIAHINMKSKLISFGNLKQCQGIKLEDITPSETNNKTVAEKSTTTLTVAPSLQIKPKPIQKNSSQPIPDKEYANNDLQKKPDENRPSQEALERADKEYSRMILGE